MAGTRAEINDFLGCRRMALVGASRDAKDFSGRILREFCRRGYDVVPVNPSSKSVQGLRSYARVQEIEPAVEAALLMTPAAATEQVVRDCIEAGIRRVWIYGIGSENPAYGNAVHMCRTNQVQVVEGHCPLMFLPKTGWAHTLHGAVLKVCGKYPKSAGANGGRG